MTTRHNWIFGLAGLGLAIAAPAQAAPNYFMEDVIILAKRDQADDARKDPRDACKDERRDSHREAVREEPEGYGYGYERRQQKRFEDEDRPRGRR